ncbi:MAG: hypothetical protein IJW48_01250, partial [Clostridia bacterium]|nr:hypothetical protein [Clostridia bacterium]
MSQVMAETPLELLGIIEPEGLTVSEYLENPLENTIYRLTDVFGVKAIYMLLPTESRERLLIIGPYLGEQYSKQETLERLERYNI